MLKLGRVKDSSVIKVTKIKQKDEMNSQKALGKIFAMNGLQSF